MWSDGRSNAAEMLARSQSPASMLVPRQATDRFCDESGTAQTPLKHYWPSLLKRIEEGGDAFVITEVASFAEGPELNNKCGDRMDGCIKVMLKP